MALQLPPWRLPWALLPAPRLAARREGPVAQYGGDAGRGPWPLERRSILLYNHCIPFGFFWQAAYATGVRVIIQIVSSCHVLVMFLPFRLQRRLDRASIDAQ